MAHPAPASPSPRSREEHAAAKRAFFRIMEQWGVPDGQARVLLGSPSRATFYNHKRGEGGPLSPDTLERVSYVLGIYKALQLLFPNPEQADAWMRKPNRAFGGRSALEHALGGRVVDLADVRRHLDAVRGQGL
ncbi:MAG: MbcA/ParS/Xre antitoxin family protein [Myxococcota bacterium]